MIKDCSTCSFGGIDVLGNWGCTNGGNPRNCDSWDLSFEAWVALMEKD